MCSLKPTTKPKSGSHNGAPSSSRAWVDPDYRNWLLKDATAAIASFGFVGLQGEHMIAVENTANRHNLVVCTFMQLLSLAGARPAPGMVHKSAPYRACVVKDPEECLD